jgi:hypothetical protein
MIDAVTIVFTSGFLLYVAYKAYKLDRASKASKTADKSAAGQVGGRKN